MALPLDLKGQVEQRKWGEGLCSQKEECEQKYEGGKCQFWNGEESMGMRSIKNPEQQLIFAATQAQVKGEAEVPGQMLQL